MLDLNAFAVEFHFTWRKKQMFLTKCRPLSSLIRFVIAQNLIDWCAAKTTYVPLKDRLGRTIKYIVSCYYCNKLYRMGSNNVGYIKG